MKLSILSVEGSLFNGWIFDRGGIYNRCWIWWQNITCRICCRISLCIIRQVFFDPPMFWHPLFWYPFYLGFRRKNPFLWSFLREVPKHGGVEKYKPKDRFIFRRWKSRCWLCDRIKTSLTFSNFSDYVTESDFDYVTE